MRTWQQEFDLFWNLLLDAKPKTAEEVVNEYERLTGIFTQAMELLAKDIKEDE